MRTWHILAREVISEFADSCSVRCMVNIAHVVTGVQSRRGSHMQCLCVLFVSSTPGIVFNPSANAITDHGQLAKDRPVF